MSQIKLPPDLISIVSLVIYILALAATGGLSQGALGSGVQLFQTDLKSCAARLKDEIIKISQPNNRTH